MSFASSFNKFTTSITDKMKRKDRKGNEVPSSSSSSALASPDQISSTSSYKSDSGEGIDNYFELIANGPVLIHTSPILLKLSSSYSSSDSFSGKSSDDSGDIDFDSMFPGIKVKWYCQKKSGKYVDIFPNISDNKKMYQPTIFDVDSIIVVQIRLNNKLTKEENSELSESSIINLNYGPVSY